MSKASPSIPHMAFKRKPVINLTQKRVSHGERGKPLVGTPCEDALAGGAAAVQHAVQEDVVAHERAPEVHHQRREVDVEARKDLRDEGVTTLLGRSKDTKHDRHREGSCVAHVTDCKGCLSRALATGNT